MRYIVKATKLQPYEIGSNPFTHTVYDGNDFRKAKDVLMEYSQFSGCTFESRDE